MFGMIFLSKCHACPASPCGVNSNRHPGIFLDSRFCGNDMVIPRNVDKSEYM